MKNLFKILLIIAISSNTAISQQLTQTIKGRIIDVQSQSPLIGVNVIVTTLAELKGGVSDLEGYFTISQIPVGRHNLKISYMGYEEKTMPGILVTSGKEVFLEITLTESLTELNEVVIVANEQSKGVPLNEMASISALSFDVEETSRYAASFDDPARAALSFPGVKGGGEDLLNEIVIRGNSPRGLLWRIEGIEVPNPNHFSEIGSSGGGISMLSNSVLSGTDFYTGAFPAEYGNALSGVFDIKLRPGNNEKREYAFEAGVLGIQASAEGPFSKGSRASYLVNYRYSTLALLEPLLNLGTGESTVYQDLSFKLNFPGTKMGTISLWGLGGSNGQVYSANDDSPWNENSNQKSGAMGLKHTYFINNNTFIETGFSATASINKWSFDSLKLKDFDSEVFEELNRRVTVMVNHKANARHTFRGGVKYSSIGFDMFSQSYRRNTDDYFTSIDDDGSAGRFETYGQWQYRINEALTLNTGFHYTKLDLGKQASLEPRFGATYQLSDKQKLKAGYGMHSRMETVAVYLANVTVNDVITQPNKTLGFSKAEHYVLGYENRISKNLRLSTEVYYQNLFDVPVLSESVDNPWYSVFSGVNDDGGYIAAELNNGGTGKNYGIELMLEKFMNNGYYFMTTASLYNSTYIPSNGIEYNTKYNGNFIANALGGKEFIIRQKNILALNSRVIWQGANRYIPIDLEASKAEGRTVRDWSNIYNERLMDYFRIDFGISYKINKPNHSSVFSINIQNATNRINEFERFYDPESQTIRSWEQTGLLPVVKYRILF